MPADARPDPLPTPISRALRPLSWRRALIAGLLALAVSWPALHVGLHTAPWYQGFDEPNKGRQIFKQSYKYNHPPTMVASARVLGETFGELEDREDGVYWGREVIAFSSALAVAGLTAFAAMHLGWAGAALTTLLLLCLGHLQYNARVTKEEPMLLAGCALVLLATATREVRRTPLTAALLGVAGVLAVAGKYLGVVALIASLVFLLCLPGNKGRGRDALWWLAGLALCALVALAPVWFGFAETVAGLRHEFAHMTKTQSADDRHAWFNPAAGLAYLEELTRGESILILVGLATLAWRARRSGRVAELALVGLGLGMLVVVMFSNFYSSRYQLVPRALSVYLVVLGLSGLVTGSIWLARHWPKAVRWVPPVLATLGCGIFLRDQILHLPPIYRDVTTNHRGELLDWARAELPDDAVLVCDRYARLPSPDHANLRHAVQPLSRPIHLAEDDPATIDPDRFRQWSADYIVLTRQGLGRHFDKLKKRPMAGLDEDEQRRRRFYERILAQEPLWEQRFHGPHHLYSPGLQVYPLPDEAIAALE